MGFLLESPLRAEYHSPFPTFRNFFNWTMTYRQDSDVYSPYGSVKAKTKDPQYDKDVDFKRCSQLHENIKVGGINP